MKQNFLTATPLKTCARFFLTCMGLLFANFAMAAGGLDAATTQATTIKTWAYGFLGVCVFIYLIYLVIMALLDRKQWADVLVGVGYVAIAGAIIVVGEWAWSVWGS
jgi:hypothetical protein